MKINLASQLELLIDFVRSVFPKFLNRDFLIFEGDDVTDVNKHPECCLVGEKKTNILPRRNSSEKWFLTGVLIHPRVVLTCGHYIYDHPLNVVALPILGPDDVTSNTLFEIEAKIVHPQYVKNRQRRESDRGNDITVLILKEPVRQISIPELVLENDILTQDFKVTIVGFGISDKGNKEIEIKREKEVNVKHIRLDPSVNFSDKEKELGFDATLEFIAGSACDGDSGGPAFVSLGGQKKLLGLVSRPAVGSQGCGGDNVFTRIDMKTAWIKETIGKYGISLSG